MDQASVEGRFQALATFVEDFVKVEEENLRRGCAGCVEFCRVVRRLTKHKRQRTTPANQTPLAKAAESDCRLKALVVFGNPSFGPSRWLTITLWRQ